MAVRSGPRSARRLVWGALALAAVVAAWGSVAAAEEAPAPPVLAAPSAVLEDASTGRVLYQRGADVVRPPASMAKIMTLVLAVDALRTGKVRPTDLVAVSDDAYRTGGAQIWLEPGEVLPFGQLVTAVAVGSANDAAVAIAEHLSGSVPAFVAEMNARAAKIGMRHTRFVNPNGLDAAGQETRTTAMDMARLGAYASRMPDLLRLTSTREDRSLRNGKGGHLWLVNTNRLLRVVPGVDGLKTGFTNAAGYCLTATAERSGLRLVAVVMGDPSSKVRFQDATSLLNWGYANYRAEYAIRRGERVGAVPVRGGRTRAVAAVAAADAVFTLPRTAQAARVERAVRLWPTVDAPVRAGQTLGRATVRMPGVGSARVDLVAAVDVPRAHPLDLLRRLVGLLPQGLHERRTAP